MSALDRVVKYSALEELWNKIKDGTGYEYSDVNDIHTIESKYIQYVGKHPSAQDKVLFAISDEGTDIFVISLDNKNLLRAKLSAPIDIVSAINAYDKIILDKNATLTNNGATVLSGKVTVNGESAFKKHVSFKDISVESLKIGNYDTPFVVETQYPMINDNEQVVSDDKGMVITADCLKAAKSMKIQNHIIFDSDAYLLAKAPSNNLSQAPDITMSVYHLIHGMQALLSLAAENRADFAEILDGIQNFNLYFIPVTNTEIRERLGAPLTNIDTIEELPSLVATEAETQFYLRSGE